MIMKMKKFVMAAALLTFTVFMFSGCVSTKTYEQALSDIDTRDVRVEALTNELATCNKDLDELTALKAKEDADYQGRIDALMSKGITTTREMKLVENERDRLSKASIVTAARVASLEGRRDFLERELSRLKLKAGEVSAKKELELRNIKNTYDSLVREMEGEIEKGQIKITQAVDRLTVSMVEKILFDSGKAEIKPAGLKVLKRVGDILKKVEGKQVRIEGHTDNVQIGWKLREKYPTNWELSTARATNVVRYIQDEVGIAPELLSASGMSEYHPVASNDTREGKASNRRIEIVLLPFDAAKVLRELKQ